MSSIFGHQASNHTPTWHPEPLGRGTFAILSSSLTTLLLCVWTAVHLNLPEYKKERSQKYRKAGWLIMGLLAPEVVAWNAWEQWCDASQITKTFRMRFEQERPGDADEKWLRRKVQSCEHKSKSSWRVFRNSAADLWHKVLVFGKVRDDLQRPEYATPESIDLLDLENIPPLGHVREPKRNEWTLTHGFYACMGGFAVSTPLSAKQGRMILSEEGFNFLSQRLGPEDFSKVVPDISESEILDKSKSDSLAKTLVCLQALWFCTQCIARLTVHSSISLLELNVSGHCVFTLLIYAVWWKKPLSVTEPTLLLDQEESRLRETVALMCLCDTEPLLVPTLPPPLNDHLESVRWRMLEEPLSNRPSDIERIARILRIVQMESLSMKVALGHRPTTTDTIDLDLEINGFCISYSFISAKFEQIEKLTNEGKIRRGVFKLDDAEIECLSLAKRAVRTSEKFSKHRNLLVKRIPNWTILRLDDVALKWEEFGRAETSTLIKHTATVTSMGFAYGGLHLLAWNAPFHSTVEKVLWRISGVTLASVGPIFFLNCLVWKVVKIIVKHFRAQNQARRADLPKRLSVPVFKTVMFVSFSPLLGAMAAWILLYLFARVYLVVECFMNIAYLPDSAFTTPNFALYIPHIS